MAIAGRPSETAYGTEAGEVRIATRFMAQGPVVFGPVGGIFSAYPVSNSSKADFVHKLLIKSSLRFTAPKLFTTASEILALRQKCAIEPPRISYIQYAYYKPFMT